MMLLHIIDDTITYYDMSHYGVVKDTMMAIT